MLTTDKLNQSKPQTELNWCGHPMTPEEHYGGRPEHCAPPPENNAGEAIQRQKHHRKKRFSPQALANLRASMQRCRSVMEANRAKRKANA